MKQSTYTPEQLREHIHRFLIISFAVSGILLFSPEPLLQKFKLESLVNNYGPLISLICLITFSYFFAVIGGYIWNQCSTQVQQRKAMQRAELKASSLDHEERALLREFFLQRTRTLQLPIHQEAVQRLTRSHILVNIEGYSCDEPIQKFAIASAARRFITSNNLRLPINELTEEDIRYFKAARPEYIKEQLKRQWREQLKSQRRQAA